MHLPKLSFAFQVKDRKRKTNYMFIFSVKNVKWKTNFSQFYLYFQKLMTLMFYKLWLIIDILKRKIWFNNMLFDKMPSCKITF